MEIAALTSMSISLFVEHQHCIFNLEEEKERENQIKIQINLPV